MNQIRRLFYVCSLLLLSGMAAWAQSPSVRIESPSTGARNVGVRPVITIKTTYPIVPQSISWRSYETDSTPSVAKPPHTVLLLPAVAQANLSNLFHDRFAVEGEYELVDDTTLTFTPYADLHHSLEYSIQVNDLELQVGLGTATVNATPMTFTTVPATHKVVRTSIGDGKPIRCRDTVRVTFNRQLSSLSTPSGSLVEIMKLDSVTGGGTYDTSPVVCDVLINPGDSTQVCLNSRANFVPGATYFLKVNAGAVTGDSLDDRQYSFSVRSSYSIELDAASADTIIKLNTTEMTSPPPGTYQYAPGESVLIGAFDDDSAHIFHHWECPELASIHMSTNPVLSFTQGCTIAQDLHLTAVYQPKDTIDVAVLSDGCTVLQVFSSDGTHLGNSGTYPLLKDDYLIISAYNSSFLGAPSCLFKDWVSNDSRIDGGTTPLIRFYNRGTNTAVGVRSDPVGILERNNGVCIYTFIDDGFSINRETAGYQGGEDASGIIEISPAPCEFVGNSTVALPVTATIKEEYQDCFCLDSMIIRSPYAGLVRQSLGCVSTYTDYVAPTTPSTSVYFIAKRKTSGANYNLTVETEVANVKPLSGYGPGEANKRIGPKRDVTVQVWRRNKTGALKLLAQTDEDINDAVFSDNFPCNASIRLTTQKNLRENGYAFTKWYDPSLSPGPGGTPGISRPEDDGKGTYAAMSTGYNAYPIPATLAAFTVKMDEDRIARASFRQNFFLRRVGFYPDGESQLQWFDVKDLETQGAVNLNVFANTASSRQGALLSSSKFGTRVGFEFSEAVQQSTVIGALECTEVSDRCDLRAKEQYVSANPNLTWTDSKTVLLDLFPTSPSSSGPFGIPAGERFSIDVNSAIENQLGETLDPTSTPTMWAMTEIPNLNITFSSIKALSDMGDFDARPDFHSASTVSITRDNTLFTRHLTRLPTAVSHTCYITINKGEVYGYGHTLYNFTNPRISDVVNLTTEVIDIDSDNNPPCSETPNLLEIFLGLLSLIAGIYLIAEGDIVTGILLAGYFLSLVGRFWPNDADSAGYFTSTFNWNEHWFGARSGPVRKSSNQNVEVNTSYNLFTD